MKKPKRRLRYIFVSPLSTAALCEGGSTFQKKRGILLRRLLSRPDIPLLVLRSLVQRRIHFSKKAKAAANIKVMQQPLFYRRRNYLFIAQASSMASAMSFCVSGSGWVPSLVTTRSQSGAPLRSFSKRTSSGTSLAPISSAASLAAR